MATQSYFQERVAFLTTRIILAAVMEGPEGIFTGCFCPVIRSLTCVPPTSITRIAALLGFWARSLHRVSSQGKVRRYIPWRLIVKPEYRDGGWKDLWRLAMQRQRDVAQRGDQCVSAVSSTHVIEGSGPALEAGVACIALER